MIKKKYIDRDKLLAYLDFASVGVTRSERAIIEGMPVLGDDLDTVRDKLNKLEVFIEDRCRYNQGGHAMSDEASEGMRVIHEETTGDKMPPYNKTCHIYTTDGEEYDAKFIRLNPKYHTYMKDPNRWKLLGKSIYLEPDDVTKWVVKKEQ